MEGPERIGDEKILFPLKRHSRHIDSQKILLRKEKGSHKTLVFLLLHLLQDI